MPFHIIAANKATKSGYRFLKDEANCTMTSDKNTAMVYTSQTEADSMIKFIRRHLKYITNPKLLNKLTTKEF